MVGSNNVLWDSSVGFRWSLIILGGVHFSKHVPGSIFGTFMCTLRTFLFTT